MPLLLSCAFVKIGRSVRSWQRGLDYTFSCFSSSPFLSRCKKSLSPLSLSRRSRFPCYYSPRGTVLFLETTQNASPKTRLHVTARPTLTVAPGGVTDQGGGWLAFLPVKNL